MRCMAILPSESHTRSPTQDCIINKIRGICPLEKTIKGEMGIVPKSDSLKPPSSRNRIPVQSRQADSGYTLLRPMEGWVSELRNHSLLFPSPTILLPNFLSTSSSVSGAEHMMRHSSTSSSECISSSSIEQSPMKSLVPLEEFERGER